jgi:hypothetical protein
LKKFKNFNQTFSTGWYLTLFLDAYLALLMRVARRAIIVQSIAESLFGTWAPVIPLPFGF